MGDCRRYGVRRRDLLRICGYDSTERIYRLRGVLCGEETRRRLDALGNRVIGFLIVLVSVALVGLGNRGYLRLSPRKERASADERVFTLYRHPPK